MSSCLINTLLLFLFQSKMFPIFYFLLGVLTHNLSGKGICWYQVYFQACIISAASTASNIIKLVLISVCLYCRIFRILGKKKNKTMTKIGFTWFYEIYLVHNKLLLKMYAVVFIFFQAVVQTSGFRTH